MKQSVPFFRPSIGKDEIAAVVESLRSGWLTTGPQTAALHLGLDALGVGPGDEVIVPTMTFTATAEVVRYLGAQPVFADMDPATLCLNPATAAAAITPRTKVIMPVHFGGRACDMSALRALADEQGLSILDDAAHALPTHHRGALIGSPAALADVTAFSFYANKTMTTGEGGMLVTAEDTIAARARKMRLHGIDRDVFDRFTNVKASWAYDVVEAGYKYNLTDLASAIGRVQLRQVADFRAQRARLAARYDAAFAGLPLTLPPHEAEGDTHSWHLYIVQVSPDAPVTRDGFIQRLQDEGIATSVHYRPLHQMTYWAPMTEGRSFPAANAYFGRCVSLPLFMSMSDAEQDQVIEVVRDVLAVS